MGRIVREGGEGARTRRWVRFSTETVPLREQFNRLRDEVLGRFGRAELSRPGSGAFRAEMETVTFGRLSLSHLAAEPLMFERLEHLAAHRDRDELTIGLLLAGQGVVEQDGRETRIQVGDLVLCDGRRPYRIRFDTSFRQMVYCCDRAELLARLPDAERRTAQRIKGQGLLPSAAASYLFDLAKKASRLGAAERAIAQHIVDLLACALGELVTPEIRHGLLYTKVRAYIEENLADPKLTPARIAERHQLSLRYLYRLFDESGDGVASFIRRRRLERCKTALADPQQRSRSISEIAFAWGFNDASHFGRAFRETFGPTPRDFRRAAQRKPL